MIKIKYMRKKLGLLILLNCLVNSAVEAASSSGGVKGFFGELLGIKPQPSTGGQLQLEGLRQELEDLKKKEGSLRQEKESAERIAREIKDANASLQDRLGTQQREIARLHEIESKAKVEHEKHVAADKLAASRLEEIRRLGEEKDKADAEIASKNLEIEKKDKEFRRKQKGSRAYNKLEGEIGVLRSQLGGAQAASVRLIAEHEEALKQERVRQAEKDKAEHEAEEARLACERAEAEHKRIEAEQKAKELEQQLAEEKLKVDVLEHEKVVQAREQLEAQHRAKEDSDKLSKQAEQIAALEEQLREKTEEVATEHARHHKAEEHLAAEKRSHFIEQIKYIHNDASTETELLAYISDPSAFFSSTSIVYQAFKDKVNTVNCGPAHDLAVSHIMLHGQTADVKDYWTKFIVDMPEPFNYEGENVPLKLVATLHETLKKQFPPDLISDAYSTMSENVLANGGCFGIDFERSATDDELRVMIPALRLSGTRAISKITTLDEALKIILSAYWYIEHSAAPLQDGEDIIFESHRRNTTLAAAQVLKSKYTEEDVLEGLETRGVVTDKAYTKGMWTYYDQFDEEKLG